MNEAEFASTYGISRSTLRFYMERGLLRPAMVASAPVFSAKDQLRIQIIIKGKRLGFALAEIEELLSAREAASNGARAGD